MDKSIERAIRLESLVPLLIKNLFHYTDDPQWIELPVGQIRVMRMLYAGPSTASELSTQLSLSVSAITQVSNRLEGLGLIERSEDFEDRRVRHLRLTQKGHSLMYRRHTARVRSARMALAALDDQTQQDIIDSLDKLLAVCLPETFEGVDSSELAAQVERQLPPPPPHLATKDLV